MKVLSFSAVEVLPALLSKSKETTIRSAWKETHIGNDRVYSAATGKIRLEKKLAMFRIGEKVKICWRNRGTPKDAKFCNSCGEELTQENFSEHLIKHRFIFPFPKLLGTATIIDVFKIEMEKHTETCTRCSNLSLGFESTPEEKEELANKDGFKSADAMLDWFDKKYDLSQPRRFHVYRWKWGE